MKKIIFIFILMIALVTPMILAPQPTQQFNKIFLDPFYRQEMTGNTNYTYTLTVNPPDKVDLVSSAIITYQMWLNPTVEFFLTVDGQQCNTPSYEVHTTYAGAGEGTIFFDCSNIITGAGDYEIVLTPDDDTGAITGWIDLTYSNRPKGTLELHGTEYDFGQEAKLWLQLLNSSGGYVNTGVCYLDIYTPANEELIERATMTAMNHDGIYTYELIVPTAAGVYPAISRCYYDAVQTDSNASSATMTWGEIRGGDFEDTWALDLQYWKIKSKNTGTPLGTNRLNYSFEFDDFYTNCGGVSEDLLSSITVGWWGEWNTVDINHDINIYIYNYTSSAFQVLPNNIGGGSGGTDFHVTNSISTTNITTALGINATNHVQLQFIDTENLEGGKEVKNDYVHVSCDQLANPEWQEVKGSSEMHITSDKNYVSVLESGELKNTSFLEDFTFHFKVQSGVSKNETDAEIDLELLNPFPCAHVTGVNERLENGTAVALNYTTKIHDHCDISIIHDLEPGENYDIEVVSLNDWKQHYGYMKSNQLLNTAIVNTSCQAYVVGTNQTPFSIPLTTIPYGEDAMWLACASYLDDQYHLTYDIYPLFDPILNINMNFTLTQMLALEDEWAHLMKVTTELDSAGKGILAGYSAIDGYSVAIFNDIYNLTPADWLTSFAYISSGYQNWLGLNNVSLSGASIISIWNHTNRTLTGAENLWVGGTEYSPDEKVGKIVVRLVDGTDTPVDDATCELKIFYPNNTLYILMNMTFYTPPANVSGAGGIYFADFNLSGEVGVHPYGADCHITVGPSPKHYYLLDTYHVYGANITRTAEAVWNYTGTINSNLLTQISYDVWNYAGSITIITSQIAQEVWAYAARYTHGEILD